MPPAPPREPPEGPGQKDVTKGSQAQDVDQHKDQSSDPGISQQVEGVGEGGGQVLRKGENR